MRTSNLGIVAQAMGVVVLIAIVYTAFLRPDDSNPLSGISIEDGTTIEVAPNGNARRHNARKQPGHGERAPARVIPASGVSAAPDGLAADTPAGAQYSSAVDAILSRVAHASP